MADGAQMMADVKVTLVVYRAALQGVRPIPIRDRETVVERYLALRKQICIDQRIENKPGSLEALPDETPLSLRGRELHTSLKNSLRRL